MFIRYIDLKKLDEIEASVMQNLIEEYAEKLDRKLPPNANLIVQIRKHETEGSRNKYSFHIRLESPDVLCTAEEDDWDLKKAVHKVMRNLTNNFQHKFKIKGSKASKLHKPQK
ncbi:hypothetical protein J4414_01195 [Candidatus Woesearchaeota archaeon]|nr:hypothetical protein [Candidatus Woesearchaeota archaeon]